MKLNDKIAIVTGASGGMGREIVEQFLANGCKVVATDLKISDQVKQLEQKYEDNLLTVEIDITIPEQVEQLVQKTMEHYNKIDALLNVAGIAQSATDIENVTLEEWNKIFAINTTALFLTSRYVVPHMKAQNSGSIINVASISAYRPRPGLNAYVASKGAAITFSKALALELAPANIRVNVINPGPADTTMLGKFSAAGDDEAAVKENTFRKSVPLGKLITPEDIASMALYLASDDAKMITGSVMNVDGGRGI